ncbi:uncharacterized protein METZ01_LOCUS79280 [marine metagenome]|uniref:Uncharacterized protein n=1 Tax=marine metagenome TaxID=408172 RepID=A0A381UDZ0_9ZZZZ
MESIKIDFVNIFTLLEKENKNPEMYVLLKKIYQKINLNQNVLLNFQNNYKEHKESLHNLKIFNKTNFQEVFENMEAEKQKTIVDSFKNINEKIQNYLLTGKAVIVHKEEEHKCDNECSHMDMNNIFNSKKMQKLLKNKKARSNLEHQLRRTTGMRNASLEEMLSENLPKQHKTMIDNLLNNSTIKKLQETFLNEDNLMKIKNIFLKLIEKEEVKTELDKFRCIVNEDDFLKCFTEIYNKFQETGDLKSLEKIMTENVVLKNIIEKFEKCLKDDIININTIKTLLETLVQDFMVEVKKLNLIQEADVSSLRKLTKQFAMMKDLFGPEPVNEKAKEEKKIQRRNNARKKYRRQLRKKYKSGNKKKKDKN